MGRRLMVLLFALALGWPVAAPPRADQADPRLDRLFERLKATAEPAEAEALGARIWAIWAQAEEPRAARLMGEGGRAMARGDLTGALATFDRLVALAPDFAEAWNRRATVRYLLGDYDGSVADIIRTVKLEPRHYGAWSGLGLIYLALDEPAAALRSFEAALAVNPHLGSVRERVEELRRTVGGRPT